MATVTDSLFLSSTTGLRACRTQAKIPKRQTAGGHGEGGHTSRDAFLMDTNVINLKIYGTCTEHANMTVTVLFTVPKQRILASFLHALIILVISDAFHVKHHLVALKRPQIDQSSRPLFGKLSQRDHEALLPGRALHNLVLEILLISREKHARARLCGERSCQLGEDRLRTYRHPGAA